MTGAHRTAVSIKKLRAAELIRSLLGRNRSGLAGGYGGGLLEAVGAAKLFAESFDTAGRVDKFLLAGEEWMAHVADIDADARDRAAGGERVATGTVDRAGLILRMGVRLHGVLLMPVVRQGNRLTSADTIKLFYDFEPSSLAEKGGGGKRASDWNDE